MFNKYFSYIFVFYDVKEERCNKVFKVCKKYLIHHQNSIFRGQITQSDFIKFKNDIKKVVNINEDYITIIKLFDNNSFMEETLGKKDMDLEGLFI